MLKKIKEKKVKKQMKGKWKLKKEEDKVKQAHGFAFKVKQTHGFAFPLPPSFTLIWIIIIYL